MNGFVALSSGEAVTPAVSAYSNESRQTSLGSLYTQATRVVNFARARATDQLVADVVLACTDAIAFFFEETPLLRPLFPLLLVLHPLSASVLQY